jgi:hypothetical protein
MPRQNAVSTTLKTRSKDIDGGFAGREYPFAEQEHQAGRRRINTRSSLSICGRPPEDRDLQRQ